MKTVACVVCRVKEHTLALFPKCGCPLLLPAPFPEKASHICSVSGVQSLKQKNAIATLFYLNAIQKGGCVCAEDLLIASFSPCIKQLY